MDFAAFKAQLEATRSFEAEVAGARFRLRLPSQHAWRRELEQHRDEHGRLLEARAFRAVLDAALVGWAGVTAALIDPAAASDAVPFSADARTLLLDCRQDIADALIVALGNRLADARQAREAAAKN